MDDKSTLFAALVCALAIVLVLIAEHRPSFFWWASRLTNPDIIVTNTDNFEDVDAYRSAALQELARINVRRQELFKILLK